jgi:hypothetical protein
MGTTAAPCVLPLLLHELLLLLLVVRTAVVCLGGP